MCVSVPNLSCFCTDKEKLTDTPQKPDDRYEYYTIQIMMVCLMLSYLFIYYSLSWVDNDVSYATPKYYAFCFFIAVIVILILGLFIYGISNIAGQYARQLYIGIMPVSYAKWGEKSLRNTRMIGLIYSIFSLIIYCLDCPYTTFLVVFRFFSLSNVFLVYFCTVHKMVRTTFRHWPSHITSLGVALGYLAFAELLNTGDKLLGIFPFHISTAFDHVKAMTIPMTEIIGAIGLAVVLVEAYKKSITGISEDDPSTVIQGRKRTRRKLLTHWNYKQYKIIFTGENTVVWFLFGCILYALLILLAVNSSNEDAVYITIVSSVFYLSGIMAHWSIDADRLIQSEHAYLLFNGLKLSVNDIRESTPKWKDYCQVLMSLYANVCGIDSEDDYYHKLDMLLINISDGFSQDLCVHEKFISDILKTKGDINPQLMREAPLSEKEQEVSAVPKSNEYRKAQDIIFSSDLCKVLSHYREPLKKSGLKGGKNLGEYDPLDLMLLATNLFFDGREDSWELRLGKCGIGSEEGMHLLKIDTLIRMLHMYSQKECGLFWLQCAQHRQCAYKKSDGSDMCTKCMPSLCRNLHQDKANLDEYNAIRKSEIASSLIMDYIIIYLTEGEKGLSSSNLTNHISPQLLVKLRAYLANLDGYINQNMRSNASMGSLDRFNGIKELQEWVKKQDGITLLFDELLKAMLNVHTNTNFQDTCIVSRMELLVNYPLFVKQSFESRWEQAYDDVLFAEDGLEYLYELFECELFAGSTEQCNMAVERIMKRLSEHSEVSAYLQAFSQKLEGKHSDILSKARIEYAKCKCNMYTEDSKWEDFASNFVHLAKDGKRTEDARTILTKISLPAATIGEMLEGPRAEMKPYPRVVYYLFCPIEGG